DFGERRRASQHDLPRGLNPPASYIRKRRNTKCLLEGMGEMADAEIESCRQLRRADGAFQMLIDEAIYALDLPSRQTAVPTRLLGQYCGIRLKKFDGLRKLSRRPF